MILVAVLVTVSSLAFVQTARTFIGEISVESLNFTVIDTSNPFLSGMSDLTKLRIQGEQTLVLAGRITLPDGRQYSDASSQLRIDLSQPSAQLTLSSSNFALEELVLGKPSAIQNFRYSSFSHRLNFNLLPGHPATTTWNKDHQVLISTMISPIELELRGYEDNPSIGLQNLPPVVKLLYEPYSSETIWTIPSSATIDITRSPSSESEWPPSARQWIWGDLAVVNVEFFKRAFFRPAGVVDSTVLEGTIHMGEQSAEIGEGQFISITGAEGISRLREMQIKPNGAVSLLFSGKASIIKVGIDPQISGQILRGTVLGKWLSTEAIVLLITCLSTVIASLLPQLFASSGSTSNSQN